VYIPSGEPAIRGVRNNRYSKDGSLLVGLIGPDSRLLFLVATFEPVKRKLSGRGEENQIGLVRG
jgi:hypothetical protein